MSISLTIAWAFAGALNGASLQPEIPRSPTVDAVLACQAQTSVEARLACYDRTVAALRQGLDAGTVLALDPRQARRSMFGLSTPEILERAGDREEMPSEITARVQSAGHSGFQRWIVTLDNGQVWRTTDMVGEAPPPRAGTTVQLSRGALANYWLRVPGFRSLRAVRVR